MKYFIDTNIFLRVLIKENKKTHKECLSLLKKVKNNQIKAVTAGIVLAEVVWVLSSYYRFSKKETARALKSLISLKNLEIIDKYDYFLAIQLFETHQVKYVDALIASIKEVYLHQWSVISYDRDFDKLGIKRIEPIKI